MSLVTPVKRKLHYGWVIFGLAFANLTVEGGAKNSQPVFLVALRNSFQRSATYTSAIFSVSGLVGAFASPILGRLLDRFGPRAFFTMAGVFILVGWVASSFISDLWQLFIFYSVIATIGQTAISAFAATANLAPWFPRSKGAALGMADAGSPTGQAIAIPLAQLIVSTLGWRAAYQIFGVAFFLMSAPLNLLFQKRPPSYFRPEVRPGDGAGLEPILDTPPALEPPPVGELESVRTEANIAEELPDQKVLRQPAVWLLMLVRATGSIANQMTQVHLIAFFILSGYGELQAGLAIGVSGLLGIGARPGLGLLSDVFGREMVFAIASMMAVCAILAVLFFGAGGNMVVLIVFVGLTGLSDGVGGLLVGAKAADLYPPRMLGSVMGFVVVGRGIGAALGPILAGFLFDLRGDYLVAFSLAAGFTLVSAFLMLAMKFVQGPARY